VIRGATTALAEQGWRYAIVDAVNDIHLATVGEAAAAHALITGGSGVAMGLPATFPACWSVAGAGRSRRAGDIRGRDGGAGQIMFARDAGTA
jgi:uncharacterized protein YgbK (DUF1537 family)